MNKKQEKPTLKTTSWTKFFIICIAIFMGTWVMASLNNEIVRYRVVKKMVAERKAQGKPVMSEWYRDYFN